VQPAAPWTPHRGKPDTSPQTATALGAIPQARLGNPAIEEDEIVDAQIVPEAPMSPPLHANQSVYGHPPSQQDVLQQDYSQQPHQYQPYPQPHGQLSVLTKVRKRTPTNSKFFRVAFAIQGVIGAGMLIAIAFARGFWGLQTRSMVTKFGAMVKGDQAVGMAKFFILLGGLIAFAGMGFILKYLLH